MARKTERETLESHIQSTYIIDQMIHGKMAKLDEVAELIPGFIHINDQHTLQVEKLYPEVTRLGITAQEIIDMGEDYLYKYLHPETQKRVFPKFLDFYSQNDTNAVCSDFQYVLTGKDTYQWIFTATKISLELGKLISVSNFIDTIGPLSDKLERLLSENLFLRRNFKRFASLTRREKEILKLIALGFSNKEICDQLHISQFTVTTHRRNLKAKLEAKRITDIQRYAIAFGLI